jgi:hypothetical protein
VLDNVVTSSAAGGTVTVSVGRPSALPPAALAPPVPVPGFAMRRSGWMLGHLEPAYGAIAIWPLGVGTPFSAMPTASGSGRYGKFSVLVSCTT